jgi:hypothetical protein
MRIHGRLVEPAQARAPAESAPFLNTYFNHFLITIMWTNKAQSRVDDRIVYTG